MSNTMFSFQDTNLSKNLIQHIRDKQLSLRFMHVCGTHQDTLMKHGLNTVLSDCGITIIPGPGCPVCVTTPQEIEEMILLARKKHIIATFGDMLQVPGENESLQDLRTEGCNIKTVYSITDAVQLAYNNPDKEIIFMAVGFETTAPATATILQNQPPNNFSVLCCHRLIPPALKSILEMGEIDLDGFIDPGHVSTIIGIHAYDFISKDYHIPQVVAGFEPIDILMAVWMLIKQYEQHVAFVENEYARAVHQEGNIQAQKMLENVFETCDIPWRGFPNIPNSGLAIKDKYAAYDARKKFAKELKELEEKSITEHPACRCGELLRGLISPEECPLFGKTCNPSHPIGPCMVSNEGSCHITYKYKKKS